MVNKALAGKFKVTSVLACVVAAALNAGTAFAGSATAVTWNFSTASSSASLSTTGDLGDYATFTGSESPANSLGFPLSSDLGVKAYGEEVGTSVTTVTKYSSKGHQVGSPKVTLAYTSNTTNAAALYGKDLNPTETGLGLYNFPDNEISDTPPSIATKDSHSGKFRIVTTTETYQTGVVQIDLTNILAFLANASPADATLTIGSLQSPDEAIISVSASLGTIGKQIGSVASGNGSNQSTTISLSELMGESYLNITAAAAGQAGSHCQPGTPGQTVLLSTITLNVPNPSTIPAGPSVPTPASFGLLAVGGLALFPMLIRRRKMMI